MKEDFILPDIGEGIVECELVEWLVAEGEVVAEDQPVADVQTDKALVQIPSKYAGKVVKHYVKEGAIAKVHAPLFQIEIDASDSNELAPTVAMQDTPQVPAAKPQPVAAVQQVPQSAPDSARKVLATPAVRRIAREHHVDIQQVNGSGPHGRVLKEDMLSFVEQGSSAAQVKNASPITPSTEKTIIPMKGIRAAMAKQMLHSVSTIPHFTYAEEIDVTALNVLRRELNESLQAQGIKLTMMSLFIKSLSIALSKHPIVNSRMSDDATEIHQLASHNIGMAVDSPIGLLVPNIKAVNQLSLLQVADEVRRLTEQGRAGRLAPDDMKGGTITISNIGAIGGTVTTPIVNSPEVAIVGIGRMQRLPRPDANDNLVIRELMTVSWSGDHRVLDGGTIARFNNDWKQLLEQPAQMLLHLR